jgi:hypothetical protein
LQYTCTVGVRRSSFGRNRGGLRMTIKTGCPVSENSLR